MSPVSDQEAWRAIRIFGISRGDAKNEDEAKVNKTASFHGKCALLGPTARAHSFAREAECEGTNIQRIHSSLRPILRVRTPRVAQERETFAPYDRIARVSYVAQSSSWLLVSDAQLVAIVRALAALTCS